MSELTNKFLLGGGGGAGWGGWTGLETKKIFFFNVTDMLVVMRSPYLPL